MAVDVMIVESDDSFMRELASAFSTAGAAVQTFEDGEAAWEAARTQRPSLVVLSVEAAPGRPSGFTLCRRFRQEDGLESVPVFIVGSTVTEDVFEQHRRHRYPADGYWRKPVSADVLVDAARAHIPLGAPGRPTARTGSELDVDFAEELDALLDLDALGELDALQGSADAEPAEPSEPDPGAVTAFAVDPSAAQGLLRSRKDSQAAPAVPVAAPPVAAPVQRAEDEPSKRTTVPGLQAMPEEVALELKNLRDALAAAREAETAARREADARKADLERQLAQSQARAAGLEDRMHSMERQLSDAAHASQGSSTASARELLTLRTQLNRVEGDTLRLKDEIFARDHRILEQEETLQARERDFDRQLSQEREEHAGTREHAAQLASEVERLRSAVAEGASLRSELAQQLERTMASLDTVSGQADSLRSDLARMATEHQDLLDRWNDVRNQLQERDTALEQVRGEVHTGEEARLALQRRLESAERARQDETEARARAEEAVASLQASQAADAAVREEISGALARLTEEHGALRRSMEQHQAQQAALEQDLAGMSSEVARLTGTLTEREAELAALQGTHERQSASLEARESELQQAWAAIAAAESATMAAQEELARAATQEAASEERIAGLSSELAAASQTLAERSASLGRVEAERDALQQDQVALQAELAAAATRLEGLQGELATALSRASLVDGLQSRLQASDALVAMQHADVMALRQTLESAGSLLAVWQRTASEARRAVRVLDEAMGTLPMDEAIPTQPALQSGEAHAAWASEDRTMPAAVAFRSLVSTQSPGAVSEEDAGAGDGEDRYSSLEDVSEDDLVHFDQELEQELLDMDDL
jgi:predicted  nucleic acid-binding Zn-ribbon protein